jgi:hypothetical protein
VDGDRVVEGSGGDGDVVDAFALLGEEARMPLADASPCGFGGVW